MYNQQGHSRTKKKIITFSIAWLFPHLPNPSAGASNIMMTSLNGNIFHLTGPLCGELTGHRWIPITRSSDVELCYFLWSAPDQTLSKQAIRRWFETPSRLLWRLCNVENYPHSMSAVRERPLNLITHSLTPTRHCTGRLHLTMAYGGFECGNGRLNNDITSAILIVCPLDLLHISGLWLQVPKMQGFQM